MPVTIKNKKNVMFYNYLLNIYDNDKRIHKIYKNKG